MVFWLYTLSNCACASRAGRKKSRLVGMLRARRACGQNCGVGAKRQRGQACGGQDSRAAHKRQCSGVMPQNIRKSRNGITPPGFCFDLQSARKACSRFAPLPTNSAPCFCASVGDAALMHEAKGFSSVAVSQTMPCVAASTPLTWIFCDVQSGLAGKPG